MSALPASSSPDIDPTKVVPAPLRVEFITLREASFRSGRAMEDIARACRGEWSNIGLAMLMPIDQSGKLAWHVREDADSGFARVKSPENIPFDWASLKDHQRAKLRERKALLDAWLEARADGMARNKTERECTKFFLIRLQTQGESVARGTLFRWYNAFRAAGYAGLLDGRLRAKQDDGSRAAFIEVLKRAYLTPRPVSAELAYAVACFQIGDKPAPFGVRQARNILNALDEKVVAFHRLGERAYQSTCSKHIVRSYVNMASNETWVSDGHTLNFFIRVPGKDKPVRPTLVSWMDVRSRKVVGWKIVARAENADVVLAAFRMGVQTCGLPAGVYHDNGEAFDATTLQGVSKANKRKGVLPSIDLGVFPRLGVSVRHAQPFNAKSKIIERWHRTIDERFSKLIPTYTGGSIDAKPHDLEEQKARNCPDLETVVEMFGNWLAGDYHARPHTGRDMNGKTPDAVYVENLVEARPIDSKLLLLELSKRIELKVGRNGIRVNYHDYESPELDRMMGKTVYALVDDSNLGRVGVVDEQGQWVCWATAIRETAHNATAEQLREAIAETKRDTKRVRQAEPARKRLRVASDPADRLAELARRASETAVTPEPKIVHPFKSKLDPAAVDDAGVVSPPAPPTLRLADAVETDPALEALPSLDDPNYYAKSYLRRRAKLNGGVA